MTSKKNTRRALFMSVMSLILCFAMLMGTTFAWFTDSVTSKNNIIKSGNLDVELKYAKVENGVMTGWNSVQDATDIFNPGALWEPGHVEVAYLEVSNLGSLALKYQLGINVVDEDIGKSVTGADLKLSDHLVFTAVPMGETLTTYTDREAAAAVAGVEKGLKDYDSQTKKLEVGKTEYVALIVCMPETVGNEANHVTNTTVPQITLGVNLYATQVENESDSFGDNYDDGAWGEGFKVYNGQELQTAIDAGETNIALENDITLDQALVIPAATTTYSLRSSGIRIDLNGKTLNNPNGYVIENKGNIVITGNGTISGLGGIRSTAGSVVIENGNFYASSRWQDTVYQHTLKAENSNVVINGGNFDATVNGHTNAMLNASENATITINGGNFKNVSGDLTQFDPYIATYEKNGKIIINDGTFHGGWRFNGEATTDIYGGNFTVGFDGQSFNTNSTHDVTVYGGTFTAGAYAKLTGKLNDLLAVGYKAFDNGNGTYTVKFPQESFDSLIDNAGENATVEIPAGTYTFPASSLKAGQTLNCAEGTVFEGNSKLNINGATVVGATFSNPTGTAADQTINGTFKDCTFDGSNGLRWCYAGETAVFENCVFSGDVYGVHFDGGANDVVFKNCTFSGFNAMGGEIKNLTMEGCTFKANGRSNYNGINLWGNTEMTNCTFVFDGTVGYEWVDLCGDNTTGTFTGCVVTDGTNETPIENVIGNYGTGNTVIVDGVRLVHSNDDLNDAVASGDNVAVNLAAGSYTMPSSSTTGKVTISGTKDTVLDVTKGAYMDSADGVTIEGVTIKTGTGYVNGNGADYAALYAKDVTYKNCTFVGPMRVGRDGAKFINCTFTELGNDYIWTYGNDVTFEGCTFNTDGKAILIYSDGGNEVSQVVVNNCKFNATAGAKAGAIANQNCAAIEIYNYGNGVNLTTSGNTYDDSNFSGEWRIKTYETGKPQVFVNGTEYTTIAIDGKTMTIDANKNVTVNG